ncbi:hypothetical protein [Mycobacterium szulgai]|uniref:Uncharacterized protein n=1 Tax=Mycobacterium szulgai TaxID=1787 RepID=A0A1X2F6S5_MYCSZ|nr:hypothetical protein [Mycobacterium szulgai]MCV7077953.1 hypothetical protein [Mycobacterium szulgai]ORX13699.1 hypothetical protein AWC27_21020 [Mycobacterium szulgai]
MATTQDEVINRMTIARDNAREEILLDGFVDFVSFNQVHRHVMRQHPSATVSDVQAETLEMIRSIVTEGLFELGDRAGENGCFAAWEEPLEVSMQKLYDAYVTHFNNRPGWVWCCWLNETDKGERLVLSTERGKQLAQEVDERLREARDANPS